MDRDLFDLTDVKRAMAALVLRPLSPAAIRVGIRLLHHYDSATGLCNPGRARLMRDLDLSRSSVKRALRELSTGEGRLFDVATGGYIWGQSGAVVSSQYTPRRAAFFGPAPAAGKGSNSDPFPASKKGVNPEPLPPNIEPEGVHFWTEKGVNPEPQTNNEGISIECQPIERCAREAHGDPLDRLPAGSCAATAERPFAAPLSQAAPAGRSARGARPGRQRHLLLPFDGGKSGQPMRAHRFGCALSAGFEQALAAEVDRLSPEDRQLFMDSLAMLRKGWLRSMDRACGALTPIERAERVRVAVAAAVADRRTQIARIGLFASGGAA